MKKLSLLLAAILFCTGVFASHNPVTGQERIKQVSKEDLIALLPTQYRQHSQVNTLLDKTFEAKPRYINSERQYGVCFSINPEILHKLMQESKEKKILEIAGASGENAIFLALAGASRVYMNDISPKEIAAFTHQKNLFRKDIKDKLSPLKCDLFALNKKIPANTLDMILARNILHFFKPKQHKEFFNVVSSLLKPGGKLVIVANSYPEHLLPNHSSTQTCFKSELLVQDTLSTKGESVQSLIKRVVELRDDEDADPLAYEVIPMTSYADTKINNLNQVSEKLHPTIAEQQKSLQPNQKLRVIKNNMILFVPKTLSAILTQNGYTTQATYTLNAERGHIVENPEDVSSVAIEAIKNP